MIFVRQQHLLHRVVMCVLAASLGAACHATEVPLNWKTECVGRYQISLPGDVEVALAKTTSFPQISSRSPYMFEDGTTAYYSGMSYEGGVFISQPITHKEVMGIVRSEQEYADKARKKYIKKGDKEKAKIIGRLSIEATGIYAWRGVNEVDLYFYIGSRLFYWGGGSQKYDENEALMYKLIDNFRSRSLFDIPKENGVCFPYAFIPDDGNAWQKAGVTMRLKDHPDVEIYFLNEGVFIRPYETDNLNTKEELRFFWERNYANGEKKLRYDWPTFRSVKLDGREGESTFVEITRADDSQDFGYAAYVKGDPDAAQDTPNLMLYVIRTASRAQGKPVSEGELKEMAHKIAASIRRRIP